MGWVLGFVLGLVTPYGCAYLRDLAESWFGNITMTAIHQHWEWEQKMNLFKSVDLEKV